MAAAAALTVTAAAYADAVDGSWCNRTRHLAIEGPDIIIPGGKQNTGDYDRHGFIYTVPPGDEGAGARLFMILLDEDTMELRAGSEQVAPETWRRCATPVSYITLRRITGDTVRPWIIHVLDHSLARR